jgi:hypothetical protein
MAFCIRCSTRYTFGSYNEPFQSIPKNYFAEKPLPKFQEMKVVSESRSWHGKTMFVHDIVAAFLRHLIGWYFGSFYRILQETDLDPCNFGKAEFGVDFNSGTKIIYMCI